MKKVLFTTFVGSAYVDAVSAPTFSSPTISDKEITINFGSDQADANTSYKVKLDGVEKATGLCAGATTCQHVESGLSENTSYTFEVIAA